MDNVTRYQVIGAVADNFVARFKAYERNELINEVYADSALYKYGTISALQSFAAARILNFLRKEQRWHQKHAEELSLLLEQPQYEQSLDLQDEAEFWLNMLVPNKRMLLVLKFWEALTAMDIARLLSKPVGAIKKGQSTAILFLRKQARFYGYR